MISVANARPTPRPGAQGFSLVEVVLALGIVGFVLAALIGMITTGLRDSQRAADEVAAANLASVLISQRRALPIATAGVAQDFVIPPVNVDLQANVVPEALAPIFLNQAGEQVPRAEGYFRCTRRIKTTPEGVSEVYLSLSTPPIEEDDAARTRARYEVITHIRVP